MFVVAALVAALTVAVVNTAHAETAKSKVENIRS
jgi:hypothetical protein